ncbi:hypothetical protein [Psychromonas sp. SP041]|uniref:hypothetical protein n=1 Tax=Psychromonas sp. SP041 TaxID=1365007 RepID=UPI0010C7BC87|nr:hypothetical protein [Psychromonas sp. SP041]
MTKFEPAISLAEQCKWDADKLCYLTELLKDDSQYVTWVLVFLGWAITVVIAYSQWRYGSKSSQNSCHNEWVREFREKLEILEDDALLFWTTTNQSLSSTIMLTKLTRGVKELTTIANDIKKVGGGEYQSSSFKELRQSITNDKELDARPIADTHYRIVAIRTACSDLRRYYRRKSD